MGGEAGTIDARLQRAEIVRQPLGKHRDHAVGEINRVAAPSGFAVERGGGADVPGDIGDRHDKVPTAAVLRVGVGLGPDRVVEVAGIAAVDGDQREVTQIGPCGQARRHRRLGFGDCRSRKFGRDVIIRDNERTYHAGIRGVSEPVDDAGSRGSEPPGREFLDGD